MGGLSSTRARARARETEAETESADRSIYFVAIFPGRGGDWTSVAATKTAAEERRSAATGGDNDGERLAAEFREQTLISYEFAKVFPACRGAAVLATCLGGRREEWMQTKPKSFGEPLPHTYKRVSTGCLISRTDRWPFRGDHFDFRIVYC